MKKLNFPLWIFLAAAAVRLIYFFQIKDHFLFETPILDAKYYHDWAVSIAQGDWLGVSRGVFMMSPGYSYFLAIVYKIAGVAVYAPVLLQFAAGIGTGILIYFIGKKYFSSAAASLAAALYLFYPPALFYESTLLKTSLINFVNIAALYCVSTPGLIFSFAAGALVGFSAQMRPNALILVPLIILWWWVDGSDRLRRIILFCAGIALIMLPVALRNYHVGKEFVLSTAHGGMNFYTGNSPYCLGPYTPMPFARTDPEVEQADFLAEASRRAGKGLTPKESSSFWYRASLDFMIKEPARWFSLVGRKTLIFFNDYEPPINLDFYFFKEQYNSLLSKIPLSFGVILPLGVLGIVFARPQALLLGYLGLYFLINIVFFVVAEYRFPIIPLLCLYAGFGAELLLASLKNGRAKKPALAALVAVVFFFVANKDIYTDYFGFSGYKQANLANAYFGMGVTYESKGMINEAVRSYEQAVAIMPQSAPLVNLATIHENRGDLETARRLNEQAVRVNPRSSEAYNNLGAVLFKQKQYKAARQCFERALELQPDFAQAAANLKAISAKISDN